MFLFYSCSSLVSCVSLSFFLCLPFDYIIFIYFECVCGGEQPEKEEKE